MVNLSDMTKDEWMDYRRRAGMDKPSTGSRVEEEFDLEAAQKWLNENRVNRHHDAEELAHFANKITKRYTAALRHIQAQTGEIETAAEWVAEAENGRSRMRVVASKAQADAERLRGEVQRLLTQENTLYESGSITWLGTFYCEADDCGVLVDENGKGPHTDECVSMTRDVKGWTGPMYIGNVSPYSAMRPKGDG